MRNIEDARAKAFYFSKVEVTQWNKGTSGLRNSRAN